jgi:YegS/Rv2252/BmrU family lipid kinase
MKICFIFSKKAGGQRIGSISWEIRKYMERAGIEFEMEIAEYPGHVEEMARRASWADVVVAVGGDGTVNEVVNGIMGKGAALGIIPIGSGNGFARSLGIPLSVKKACRLISDGSIRFVDIGFVRTPSCKRYFASTFGCGFDAILAKEASHERSIFRALWVYIWKGIKSYGIFRRRIKRMRVEGEMDGEEFKRTCMMMNFANSREYGGGAKVAPMASLEDGMLDVVLMDPVGIWRGLGHLSALFMGGFTDRPGIESKRIERAFLKIVDPPIAQMDGDPFPLELPVEVGVIQKGLPVIS